MKIVKGLGLLLIFLLTSCGFHLRGFVDMPSWLDSVAIVIENANVGLRPALRQQLEANHVMVNPSSAQANYLLIIEQDNFSQQIISISASTTPRQYQMIYTVTFRLQNRKGKPILPSNIVTVSRPSTVNNNRILGSDEEETILKSEMMRDVAIQILNRIRQYH